MKEIKTESQAWLTKFKESEGFDFIQLIKELPKTTQTEAFWVELVKAQGFLFGVMPKTIKRSEKLKREALKSNYFNLLALDSFDEELKLSALLTNEGTTEVISLNQIELEDHLLGFPNQSYREVINHPLLNPLIQQWEFYCGKVSQICCRKLLTDEFDGEDWGEVMMEELWIEGEKAKQFSDVELIPYLERNPYLIYWLHNHQKSYRLCRYALRLNQKTQLASPYHALETIEALSSSAETIQ